MAMTPAELRSRAAEDPVLAALLARIDEQQTRILEMRARLNALTAPYALADSTTKEA